MRLLLISTFFPPQHAVASLRAASFATSLAAAGHDVTVLTTAKRPDQAGLDLPVDGCSVVEIPSKNGPVRKLLRRLGQPRAKQDDAQVDGARLPGGEMLIGHLRRAAERLRDSSGIFSAARMPDLTDAWVAPATQWAIENGPWDLLLSTSGPYTTHVVARQIRRRGLAKRWVADFRDLWTDNDIYRGLFPFTMLESRRERQCLEDTDVITTVSEGLAETLRGKSTRRVEVIYNGYDERSVDCAQREQTNRDCSAKATLDIVYTGTVYPPARDPQPLVEALGIVAKNLARGEEALRLIVAGERADVWSRLASRLNVRQMLDLRGVVSHQEARRLQYAADGLILLDWNGPQRGVLTTKVFEYLAADAPILAIGRYRQSSLGELLGRTGRGIHLGDDPRLIAKTLLKLARDVHCFDLTPNHALIASLSRQRQAARLVQLIEELAAQRT